MNGSDAVGDGDPRAAKTVEIQAINGGGGGQRTEDRGQRSEVRGQREEPRSAIDVLDNGVVPNHARTHSGTVGLRMGLILKWSTMWRTSQAERGHDPSGALPTPAPGFSRGLTVGALNYAWK